MSLIRPSQEGLNDNKRNVVKQKPKAGLVANRTPSSLKTEKKSVVLKSLSARRRLKLEAMRKMNLEKDFKDMDMQVRKISSLNEFEYLKKYNETTASFLKKYNIWRKKALDFIKKNPGSKQVQKLRLAITMILSDINVREIEHDEYSGGNAPVVRYDFFRRLLAYDFKTGSYDIVQSLKNSGDVFLLKTFDRGIGKILVKIEAKKNIFEGSSKIEFMMVVSRCVQNIVGWVPKYIRDFFKMSLSTFSYKGITPFIIKYIEDKYLKKSKITIEDVADFMKNIKKDLLPKIAVYGQKKALKAFWEKPKKIRNNISKVAVEKLFAKAKSEKMVEVFKNHESMARFLGCRLGLMLKEILKRKDIDNNAKQQMIWRLSELDAGEFKKVLPDKFNQLLRQIRNEVTQLERADGRKGFAREKLIKLMKVVLGNFEVFSPKLAKRIFSLCKKHNLLSHLVITFEKRSILNKYMDSITVKSGEFPGEEGDPNELSKQIGQVDRAMKNIDRVTSEIIKRVGGKIEKMKSLSKKQLIDAVRRYINGYVTIANLQNKNIGYLRKLYVYSLVSNVIHKNLRQLIFPNRKYKLEKAWYNYNAGKPLYRLYTSGDADCDKITSLVTHTLLNLDKKYKLGIRSNIKVIYPTNHATSYFSDIGMVLENTGNWFEEKKAYNERYSFGKPLPAFDILDVFMRDGQFKDESMVKFKAILDIRDDKDALRFYVLKILDKNVRFSAKHVDWLEKMFKISPNFNAIHIFNVVHKFSRMYRIMKRYQPRSEKFRKLHNIGKKLEFFIRKYLKKNNEKNEPANYQLAYTNGLVSLLGYIDDSKKYEKAAFSKGAYEFEDNLPVQAKLHRERGGIYWERHNKLMKKYNLCKKNRGLAGKKRLILIKIRENYEKLKESHNALIEVLSLDYGKGKMRSNLYFLVKKNRYFVMGEYYGVPDLKLLPARERDFLMGLSLFNGNKNWEKGVRYFDSYLKKSQMNSAELNVRIPIIVNYFLRYIKTLPKNEKIKYLKKCERLMKIAGTVNKDFYKREKSPFADMVHLDLVNLKYKMGMIKKSELMKAYLKLIKSFKGRSMKKVRNYVIRQMAKIDAKHVGFEIFKADLKFEQYNLGGSVRIYKKVLARFERFRKRRKLSVEEKKYKRQIMLKLGEIYFKKNVYGEAEKYLRKAISISSNSMRFILDKKTSGSLLALINLRGMDETDYNGLIMLARIFADKGQIDKAIDYVKVAMKFKGGKIKPLYYLAHFYYLKGGRMGKRQAMKYAKMALRLKKYVDERLFKKCQRLVAVIDKGGR